MAKAKPLPKIDPDASLFAHAAVAVATRLDEMLDYERYMADPNAVYELHQMRIAAKRLRYTMDIYQPAFIDFSRYGKAFASYVEEIKLLQEHLGEIHDADVLVPQLTAQLQGLLANGSGKDKHGLMKVGVHYVDFAACQGLLALCQEAQAERDRRFVRLQQEWGRLKEQKAFEGLRRLLRDVITEETLHTVLQDSTTATGTLTKTTPRKDQAHDEAAHDKTIRPTPARRTRRIPRLHT